MSQAYEKNKLVKMTTKKYVLVALFIVALVSAGYRYYVGLSSTNLSDNYPWGLWIAVDLIATALACVGFSMTLITKIFHRHEFKDLTKRAVLIALLFYVLISMVLMVEIGRWDNFWRPFVSPGISSPMFIVLLCVAVYTFLLLVEAYEIIGEKANLKYFNKVKAFIPIVAIFACVIPIAYQASLGSIYFAMEGKLHTLWSSPLMPFFFVLSAFLAGFAVMIFETLTISKDKESESTVKLLSKLSKIAVIASIIFLVTKVLDIMLRGNIQALISYEGSLFVLELVFISVIPILFYVLGYHSTQKGLLLLSSSILLGLCLTRLNIIFTGMHDYLGGGYWPSLVEVLTTLGFSAFVFFLYLLVIEKFKF